MRRNFHGERKATLQGWFRALLQRSKRILTTNPDTGFFRCIRAAALSFRACARAGPSGQAEPSAVPVLPVAAMPALAQHAWARLQCVEQARWSELQRQAWMAASLPVWPRSADVRLAVLWAQSPALRPAQWNERQGERLRMAPALLQFADARPVVSSVQNAREPRPCWPAGPLRRPGGLHTAWLQARPWRVRRCAAVPQRS